MKAISKQHIILLDLDGPILDNSVRLYRLYKELLSSYNLPVHFSLKDYWRLKRNQVREEEILKRSGLTNSSLLQKCLKKREKLIEKKSYLALNKPVPGAKRTLQFLSQRGKLVLVTNRKARRNLFWELRRHNIKKYFYKILSAPAKEHAWQTKIELIKNNLQYDHEDIFFVGDTEAEFVAGRRLRIKTVAVLNGIRSKEMILRYRPDYICKSIVEVPYLFEVLGKYETHF